MTPSTGPARVNITHRSPGCGFTVTFVDLPGRAERRSSLPSAPGPEDYFTGTVRIDPMFQADAPGRTSGAHVTFEPGARTAWHTHPAGQTIIITFGCGRVQREGGPIEEVTAGDVVFFPAEEKHWHGATPTTAMTHLAIQEKLDGSAVEGLEKVTDEEYGAATAAVAAVSRLA